MSKYSLSAKEPASFSPGVCYFVEKNYGKILFPSLMQLPVRDDEDGKTLCLAAHNSLYKRMLKMDENFGRHS